MVGTCRLMALLCTSSCSQEAVNQYCGIPNTCNALTAPKNPPPHILYAIETSTSTIGSLMTVAIVIQY